MKTLLVHTALIVGVTTLMFTPALAGATALSDLTAATTSHNIDNGNNEQEWDWDALTSGYGFLLNSAGTAAGNGQVLLRAEMSGANSASNVNSYTANFSNAHTGTNATNYGLVANGQQGTHNYGVYGNILQAHAGDAGVWGDSGTIGGAYGIYGTSGSATGYAGYFNNSSGGYAAAFLGGNVGIGTATPLNLLDIGTSGGIHIASGVPGATSMALYNNSGTLTWNGVALGTGSSVSGTTNYIPYFTGSSSLGNSVIYQSGSSIGIGTTTPLATLDVHGGVSLSPSGANGINVTSASGYDSFDISYAGNVSNAISSRDTSGGTGAQTAIYFLRNGSFVGTITTTNVATGYNTSSDKRLKENIKPISDSGDIIDALNPVHYDWKYIEGHPEGYGLLAQDAYRVFPDAIAKGDDGSVDGQGHVERQWFVDYSKFVPVLLAEVKSLRQRTAKDEAEIVALKQKTGMHP